MSLNLTDNKFLKNGRLGHDAAKHHDISWTNVDPDPWQGLASLGHNVLR